MLKTLSVIIYLILFILIFEQIFRLTHFVYKYNKFFDYGKILQNICKNEYIERETSRFHIALNEKNILISNTNDNKKNYYKLLLVISILFTSVISIIFSLIIYNIYCNINLEELNKYKIQHKIYILVILSICIITIIYPILLIFYKLKKIKYRKNFSLFETNRIDKLIPFICIFIGLIIFKIVLIYYKYKVPTFETINDYNNNNNINQLILFSIYGIVYMIVIYYITNFIILYNYYNEETELNDDDNDNDNNIINYYLNKVIGFKEHNKYINKISSIVKIDNTLKETKNNKKLLLPTKLENIDDVPDVNKNKIYDSILNSITNLDQNKLRNVINNTIMLYINEKYSKNLIKKTNEKNNKEVDINILNKTKNKLKDEFPNEDVDFIASIILQKIILEIDNLIILIINNNNPKLEENNEKKITYEKETIFRKNLSGIIFILIIILLVIGIIQLILKNLDFKILHNNINLYIFIPFIILFILLFIINSTIEYNSLINKYIVKNPIEIYKKNINNMNDKFNNILEEEYYKYLNKQFNICKNVRNSIIQVLLSNILYFNLLNDNNNINILIQWNNLASDIKNNNDKCNNEEIEYDDFKFDSCIIRNSCNSTNIFYGRENNINNCNLLNYTNIKKLIKNLLIFDNINFTDEVQFVNIKENISDNKYELNKDELFNNVTEGNYINIKSNEWLKLKELNNINYDNYYMYNLKLDKNNYRIKDDDSFNKLLREIYLKTNNNNIENISDYILYEIIYNNNIYAKFKSRIEYVKNNLKNIIYTSLYNSIVLENNELNSEYIVNENNIKNYIINEYENHNSLKQYNNIVDNIVNKYIKLLIKNIYLLSKLLNANNNIIELGELYNKLIDEPNIVDKNKRNYISLKFKNEIISYINNLVKEIAIFFDDINNDFKLKNTNFKNILNNYIINNYNNINENNVYTKDIILPYFKKNINKNNHKKKLENLLTIIDLNNKNYNNLRKYICEKEYDINNECNLNSFKLDIKNIKKDLIDNIHNINKFIDEYDIIIKNKDMIEFIDNLNIVNDNYKTDSIINILNQISNNYNKLNQDDNGLKIIYENILKKLENENMINTDEKLKEIKQSIKEDLYSNNLKLYNKNIEIYNIIKNTLDNTEIIKNIKYNNVDKNTSIELNNNINQVNKSLLILIIVYIISIILINYIR